jgi:hypothetical protein
MAATRAAATARAASGLFTRRSPFPQGLLRSLAARDPDCYGVAGKLDMISKIIDIVSSVFSMEVLLVVS